ncbi:YoaK family protein [Winogradskyella helgolandensis]|uniref:YoaK family protein n=1 Tax=Winogradskyella helgolandensis TaxID=2697010 RepID=UPI0015BB22A3|nr:YoaK family protein [Winogradskyella helgolandensis]
MFRHQGKSRTLLHNLRIATILSFVAGIVNVTGFLAFHQLTTNVTGHFALFISDVANFEFWKGTIFLLYILSFLFGSFFSSFLIEKFKENKRMNVFVLPTLIEVLILVIIAFTSDIATISFPNVIICALLFAMGLQNSLVTKISNAVVRTTHLTGLFTDLGIELSQLCFRGNHHNRTQIIATIKLRIAIICFFFFGGLVGGYLYSKLDIKLNTLLVAAFILAISLFYDDLRYGYIKTKRKYSQRN